MERNRHLTHFLYPSHKWTFRARFRRRGFGWRSQPAIKRIKEAVSEIKKASRKDLILGAEGAVLLLEKLSPALEHVDSSSGAIGTAVNKTVEILERVRKMVAGEVYGERFVTRILGRELGLSQRDGHDRRDSID